MATDATGFSTACTMAEWETWKTCQQAADSAGINSCEAIQKSLNCYPKCACNDAAYKPKVDQMIVTYGSYGCSNLGCGGPAVAATAGAATTAATGAATSIHATVFTGIVAAFVAIFAAQ
jgi:hypothetical protein